MQEETLKTGHLGVIRMSCRTDQTLSRLSELCSPSFEMGESEGLMREMGIGVGVIWSEN